MNPTMSSSKVHRIVEYIRLAGFDLESDELTQMGAKEALVNLYDYTEELSETEYCLLESELMQMAIENEIAEALIKHHEYLERKADPYFDLDDFLYKSRRDSGTGGK